MEGTHTQVLSVIYETLHSRCLMLESLLCAAVHFVSTVKEIGCKDDREITAVHLILSTSERKEQYTHTLHVFKHKRASKQLLKRTAIQRESSN